MWALILLHCSKSNSRARATTRDRHGKEGANHYNGSGPRDSGKTAPDAGVTAFAGPGIAAAMGVLAGACLGSFIGTVLVRLPAERSLVRGHSACDACDSPISIADLVPIGSWLVLRGRCRACGAAIGAWQLAAEVAGAGIGFAPWLLTTDIWLAILMMAMGWQLLLLALLDARHFWLPLRLVGLLGATGLAGAIALSTRVPATAHVEVALIGGVLGWGALALVRLLYQRVRGEEGMGAADPWLMGAIGLWLGPLGVVEVLLGASLVGIVSAATMLVLGQRVAADTALPLGTCIAVAAWPLFCLQGFG